MKIPMNSQLSSIFLFLLLNCLVFINHPVFCFQTALPSKNETDKLGLLALKNSIAEDPLQALSSWNKSIHFCNWMGVRCSQRHKDRVTILNLGGKKLAGSIPPHIGNLSFLRRINLSDNSFQGPIPQEIGRLFRLRRLDLSGNSFQGKIPSSLAFCSNIQVIDLSFNNLIGQIPAEYQNISKSLGILNLSGNQITGRIPLWLGNASSLLSLSMATNHIYGGIPTELGRLAKLRFLQLSENYLSGMVPLSVFNLSLLGFLSVTKNQLHGRIPSNVGSTLANIQHLYAGSNYFYGEIPASIQNASKLEELYFPFNNLTGAVPSSLGSLKDLTGVGLAYNQLESPPEDDALGFLTSLTNCSNLQYLDFTHNLLKGELPSTIGNLSAHLEWLSIGENQISGNLPDEIGNLVGLTILQIDTTNIAGEIPPSIGKLQKLSYLYLYGNKISGTLPSSIGNITQLIELDLGGNNLTGPIPPSLGSFFQLQRLDLSYNFFTGILPKQLFSSLSRVVYMSLLKNYFEGQMPLDLGNMTKLVRFDVSYNKFSGEIPSSLGNCLMLERIRMQENLLEGGIPPSWSALKSLVELDLSRNNLSGQIPKYLQSFTMLQHLNLSFNGLEGQVPRGRVFENASAVTVTGNEKLCGGIRELGLPPCQVQRPEKSGTSHTLKMVIPVTVLSTIIILASLITFCWMRKPKREGSITMPEQRDFPQISYGQLSQATNGFSSSNLVGKGSFGSVYRGILDEEDDMSVAVKVLNLNQQDASKSFIAECKALSRIRHRNLIKIITVCSSIDFKGVDFKAIIYEFMKNGSLEEWLHPSGDQQFSFIQRLNTALEVASATEYLHYHCQPAIVHGDLKPSNVLLDHDLVAHVADFGLSRFLQSTTNSASQDKSSIGVKGTIGYIPPEYGMGSKASMAGDVYSFGILLLEMITGKRPTDSMFNDGLNIHQYTKTSFPERIIEILEPTLLQEVQATDRDAKNPRARNGGRGIGVLESLIEVTRVGVLCSMESASERMEMKDVVLELSTIKQRFLGTRN